MTALILLAASACLVVEPDTDALTSGHLAAGWQVLAALPPATVVGWAPAPGVERVFSIAELRRLAAQYHLEGNPPAPVCVARQMAALEPARLLAAMQRSLPEGRIEIADFSRFPAPMGDLFFPVEQLQPSGQWTGYIRYGGNRKFVVWARVRVMVDTPGVVAVEALPAGKPIDAAQVRLETRAAFPRENGQAHTIADVAGRIPRRAIPVGGAVMRGQLAQALDVRRGEPVRVEVRQGAARLLFEGIAEGDGHTGDRITVINPESQRRFMARVTGVGSAIAGATEGSK
jgi:flagella basal body P-ring formation protein FlgA